MFQHWTDMGGQPFVVGQDSSPGLEAGFSRSWPNMCLTFPSHIIVTSVHLAVAVESSRPRPMQANAGASWNTVKGKLSQLFLKPTAGRHATPYGDRRVRISSWHTSATSLHARDRQ